MIITGEPFVGWEKKQIVEFLEHAGLSYEEGIEYSVCVMENGKVAGTGSVERNILKCIAVAEEFQGQGICASIISQLVQYEIERGRTHLLLYTKPENLDMFLNSGFYPIIQTDQVLLMENRKNGFADFMYRVKEETPLEALRQGCVVGAVVANCNPFTLGHRFLLEQALKSCEYLHLFVVSEEQEPFTAGQGFEMVQLGTEDLDRLILHRTDCYMVSFATFPTYFYKDKRVGKAANCQLDLKLFGERISPELRIKKRFVGTEPFCGTTADYNRRMRQTLPMFGIQVIEIERKQKNGRPISATEVRKCLCGHDFQHLQELVPEKVAYYLQQMKGDEKTAK